MLKTAFQQKILLKVFRCIQKSDLEEQFARNA